MARQRKKQPTVFEAPAGEAPDPEQDAPGQDDADGEAVAPAAVAATGYSRLAIEIVGVAALIMHNGQTADPLNHYSRELKAVSGKRNKTESDFAEMARIEYHAGLYVDDRGRPIIPSRLLEAAVIEGAKKSKLGKQAQAGVIVEAHAVLGYDGPRTAQALFEDDRFRFAVPVRVGQQKVVRTRPIFREWSAKIEVSFLPDIINERDLRIAVRNAGMLCGIGDWRPRYGRFVMREDLPQAAAAE